MPGAHFILLVLQRTGSNRPHLSAERLQLHKKHSHSQQTNPGHKEIRKNNDKRTEARIT